MTVIDAELEGIPVDVWSHSDDARRYRRQCWPFAAICVLAVAVMLFGIVALVQVLSQPALKVVANRIGGGS